MAHLVEGYYLALYQEIKAALCDGGVVSVSIAGHENIMGAELVGLGASAKETLAQVFANLVDNAIRFAPPGTAVTVIFSEFRLPASVSPSADPFRWRIQDVGAPQFQLEVTGLDTLLARTKDAGYRLLSVGGRPIQRPFGRFVFAVDPDGILVEFVEPTSRR